MAKTALDSRYECWIRNTASCILVASVSQFSKTSQSLLFRTKGDGRLVVCDHSLIFSIKNNENACDEER